MSDKSILVAYSTRRGATLQAAEWIAEEIPGCTLVNIKDTQKIDLSSYDTIVLGTGVFAARAYSDMIHFLKKHRAELLESDLCLFITHLEDGEGVEKDFVGAFGEEFLAHARVRRGVGGRLKIDELNFFLKMIMKKMEKERNVDLSNVDTLSRDACVAFAREVLNRG